MFSRTHQGMLQMLMVFLILLTSIGLPTKLSSALVYTILISMSSFVALHIAERDGTAHLGSAGSALFVLHLIAFMFAYAVIFVGGVILGGNYGDCTITAVMTISISTYMVCSLVEPSKETVIWRKEMKEFQSAVTLEIENAVRELIKAYPQLDPKRDLTKYFAPVALFKAWDFVRMTAESFGQDKKFEPKSMEILESYELAITHDGGTHLVPRDIILGEISVALWGAYEHNCKDVLDWLRTAMSAHKPLCDLTVRLDDRLSLWKIRS